MYASEAFKGQVLKVAKTCKDRAVQLVIESDLVNVLANWSKDELGEYQSDKTLRETIIRVSPMIVSSYNLEW